MLHPHRGLDPEQQRIQVYQILMDILGMYEKNGILNVEIDDQNEEKWCEITEYLEVSVLRWVYQRFEKEEDEKSRGHNAHSVKQKTSGFREIIDVDIKIT